MAKQIKITIDTDANVKVEALGYKGSSCKDATKAIEAALGKTTSDTPTREMYEQADRITHQR